MQRERTKAAVPATHLGSDGRETGRLQPRAVRSRWSGFWCGSILAVFLIEASCGSATLKSNDGGATGGKSGAGGDATDAGGSAGAAGTKGAAGTTGGMGGLSGFPGSGGSGGSAGIAVGSGGGAGGGATGTAGAGGAVGSSYQLSCALLFHLVATVGGVVHGAGEATAVGAGAVALSGLTATTVKPRGSIVRR